MTLKQQFVGKEEVPLIRPYLPDEAAHQLNPRSVLNSSKHDALSRLEASLREKEIIEKKEEEQAQTKNKSVLLRRIAHLVA